MRALACSVLLATGLSAADDPATWAEPPHWPIGVSPSADAVPGKGKRAPKARLLAWIPDGVERPRSVLMLPNNSDCKDFGQHPALREVAKRHAMAIVYVRTMPANSDGKAALEPKPGDAKDGRQIALDDIAAITGKPEFRHAPWVVLGKSSMAHFAIQAAWHWPERTIASIIYHGEVPPWPIPPSAPAATRSILHCNLNGETEWGGTWYRHVRPGLLNYREHTAWLPHLVVGRGLGHGDYIDGSGTPEFGTPHPGKVTVQASWNYLSLFIDKALALRMPAEGVPTEAPLTLREVDPSSGLLIDPFATEEVWRQPPFPLVRAGNAYALGGGADPTVTGFARIAPSAEAVPEGVPVVPLPIGRSPSRWLITDGMPAMMKADPMKELGALAALRPKPGDQVAIDGTTLTFRPLTDTEIGPNGGLNLGAGLRQKGKPLTLLAYTVVEVAEPGFIKVRAPFSPAGRLQLVLDGQAVDHLQVVEMQPGRYPLLAVLRLNASWGTLEPWFDQATPEEVAQAKELGDERARRQARLAELAKAPRRPATEFIRPWSAVPEAERARMFWLPDQELADAWLAYTELAAAR